MSKKTVISVSDIIEQNGKTIKENNMEKTHRLPIGSYVKMKPSAFFDPELYPEKAFLNHVVLCVVSHVRDCDGSPLIDIGFPPEYLKHMFQTLKDKDELYMELQGVHLYQNERFMKMILKDLVTFGPYGEEDFELVTTNKEE